MKIVIPFETGPVAAELPEGTAVLRMKESRPVANPGSVVRDALASPIGSSPLAIVARRKRSANPAAKACIVVSDKTRPVPYKGDEGLLHPILETLQTEGFRPADITILVACGMHKGMNCEELECMLGSEPFARGIAVINHDCGDDENLVRVGVTARGTEALVNRLYIQSDLKILTGLVESHFMAGASGGRKSICPGLLGEGGTHVFHGSALMSHPDTRDLVLEGNPVHEESLAVARLAGADFIANVTVDSRFRMTGVFCGELEAAHAAAVVHLRESVGIPIEKPYDLVVTHGGFVAQNHYQAAKAAVASLGALSQKGGGLVLIADNRDPEPVGSDGYRAVLSLLKTVGPDALDRILASPDWTFIIDQWEAQMWAKVFKRVGMNDFVYFAPQLGPADRRIIPGVDGASLSGCQSSGVRGAAEVVRCAVARFLARRGMTEADVASGRFRIAWLADGPYGIPAYLHQ